MQPRTARILFALAALSMLASACGSDPTEVVIGVTDDGTAADESDADLAVADDSAPIPAPTTTAPAAQATVTTFHAPATTDLGIGDSGETSKLEVLGPAMVGVGEWVVLRPSGDGEDECADGALGYQVDGELVHLYDEMLFGGGIRLFNGMRGQDAFVLNCEESVTAIWLQGSAVLPDRGYPYLEEMDFSEDFSADEPRFEFLADWGWRGDLFAGFGSIRGVSELWAFGIPDAGFVPIGHLIGERQPNNEDVGVSIVVPRGWNHESTADGELVTHPFSSSRVQIWATQGSPDPPLEEGDELLSWDVVSTRVWSAGNAGTGESSLPVEVDEWTFLSDDGVRVVRYIGRESDSTIVIELFADSGDGSIDQDLPWLVLDTLRVFEN